MVSALSALRSSGEPDAETSLGSRLLFALPIGLLDLCVPVPHPLRVPDQLDVVHRDGEAIGQITEQVLIDATTGPLPRRRDQQDGRGSHVGGRLDEGLDADPGADEVLQVISDLSHRGALLRSSARGWRTPTSPPAHLAPPPFMSCPG